ncbi:MAG: hypothetical protein LBO71_02380 [Prevotellaceae bacterium]|jgi:hypothetical protein|nr:hypothetical protein [Prevotellaceae bacterium]
MCTKLDENHEISKSIRNENPSHKLGGLPYDARSAAVTFPNPLQKTFFASGELEISWFSPNFAANNAQLP